MHLVAAHVGPLLVLELDQAVALGLSAGLVLEEGQVFHLTKFGADGFQLRQKRSSFQLPAISFL